MRVPDHTGFVDAWDLAVRDHATCVAAWLLHALRAHAFWHWRYMSIVHLRPVKGLPPPRLHFPEATHELQVLSIDPERCPSPDPAIVVVDGAPYLMPPDIIQQVGGLNDEQAIRLAKLCAIACTTGDLIPDEDYRPIWKDRILATVEHLVAGGHGPQA